MKKHFFKLSFLLIALSSCSSSPEKLTPKSLDYYVIDFFVEKSMLKPQVNKKTFYFYRFENKKTYELESNDAHAYEKKGTYEYTIKSNTKANITFDYIKQDKEHQYTISLRFDDLKSGTWMTPKGDAMPGAESGSFVIVKIGQK